MRKKPADWWNKLTSTSLAQNVKLCAAKSTLHCYQLRTSSSLLIEAECRERFPSDERRFRKKNVKRKTHITYVFQYWY